MPRLVNTVGVVVDVSEKTATALGAEWKPVEVPAEPEPEPVAPRRTRGK